MGIVICVEKKETKAPTKQSVGAECLTTRRKNNYFSP
jgi:hypothetical protein